MTPVLVVVGTRPEAIKLIPVHRAFEASQRFRSVLLSTGQHREMLQPMFEFFGVAPDRELDVMTDNQRLADLTARLLTKITEVIDEVRPAAVVVQGDTTTCMVAALAAFYARVKVVHVEAGLRTGDLQSPFPEEANRRFADVLADVLFAPTDGAAEALAAEGRTAGVHVVGNTVVDSLLFAHGRVRDAAAQYRARLLRSKTRRLVLVTAHRRESFGRGLIEICAAVRELAERYSDVDFMYPVHRNPSVTNVVNEHLRNLPNVQLIEPVPYDDLVYLLGESWIVLTDSGGIQEEAPTLGKPVIVLRDTTERPEAVAAGCAVLAGNRRESIVAAFRKVADDPAVHASMSRGVNPYGDGRSAQRIVEILDRSL